MRSYYYVPRPPVLSNKDCKYDDRIFKVRCKGDYFPYASSFGLRPPKYLNKLYLYKENGVFYEFFTGIMIGKEAVDVTNGQAYIESNYFGYTNGDRINIPNPTYTGYGALTLTESQFAYDVKQYMPYQKELAKVIKIYLDVRNSIRLDYAAQQRAKEEQKRLSQENEHSRNNSDTTWLNSFINKR